MVSRDDIEAAQRRIAGKVRVTPVVAIERGAFGVDAPVTAKLEMLQHTGSFKPRGAFNRIISAGVGREGVVAASGGNHGIAVSHVAAALGVAAEVFVPEPTPRVKVDRIRDLGATVTIVGEDYAASLAASRSRAAASGAVEVHAYDQAEVVAGQGTVGAELARQAPDLDVLLVAVGGGGLIGGISSWYRGDLRIVGVEPQRAPTLHAALAAGHPVDVAVTGIAADSLGARVAGGIAYQAAARWVERIVLVSDDAIGRAQRVLWDRLRLVAEPGGATALAALTSGAYVPQPDERVGLLVCGANTDPATVG